MAADLLELPSTAAAPPAPEEPIPAKIGKYAIHGLIGRGGMGVVYRAHDPDLDRDVALKTLIPRGSADSDWVCRFRQEAHAAAKLRHPGIVPIHETGESEGLVFFTMDLIEGKSFAAALRDGGLSTQGGSRSGPPPASPEERARRLPSTLGVIASVAEALGYAHEQGIVHRDVKPQNILLDKEGRPYVTDFGLAKDVSKLSVLTETSALMGTLWYMSPEQARGSARDATAESDVFALGAILYEVLTGGLPFTGETDFEVREAIIRRSPRRPSEVEPSTPADVEAICLKALEKDPASRYPTARELALELRRCLKASEAADYIPTLEPMEESEVEELLHADARRVRRARLLRYITAGSILASVCLATALLWLRRRPSALEEAEAALRGAEEVLGQQAVPLDGVRFLKDHGVVLAKVMQAKGVFWQMREVAGESARWSDRMQECDAVSQTVEAACLRAKAAECLESPEEPSDEFEKKWKEALPRLRDAAAKFGCTKEVFARLHDVPRGCDQGRWDEEIRMTSCIKAEGSRHCLGTVGRALLWLARHQSPDGGWRCSGFGYQCKGEICDGPGFNIFDEGVTGMSLLAFLEAGYTHLSREEFDDPMPGETFKPGEIVKNALRWLVYNQSSDGCIGQKGQKMMYNQSICTLALSEAYGMTQSQILKEPAQKAVDFLVGAKNPDHAWGYTSGCSDNDTSVTGWCAWALCSAERSKLKVDHKLLMDARRFIDGCTERNSGKCGYKSADDVGTPVEYEWNARRYGAHETPAAVGIVVRNFVDRDRKDPVLELSAKLLADDPPAWDTTGKTNDYCYWYWGTLALFQYDGPDSGGSGEYWTRWNKAVIGALVKNQKTTEAGCADGSWDAIDRWGFAGGRVYATAINALTLEVSSRYVNAFGGKAPPPK